jgi:hypothetical protein
MRRAAVATAIAVATMLIDLIPASAHDIWISRGGYRNSAGEWCCGANDCEAPEQVASTGTGWMVNGKEFVPYNEATPSPDGKVWICRRPDRSRRCVFGPPPNT